MVLRSVFNFRSISTTDCFNSIISYIDDEIKKT